MKHDLAKKRASDARYDKSAKGKRRRKKYRTDLPDQGRSPNPPSWSAEAQRARRARPEYKLARRLGVSVKVAREMMQGGLSEG